MFVRCSNLSSIDIHDNVTIIQSYAFTIPPKLTDIEDDCFFWCYLLSLIIIHDDVKSIGNSTFEHCFSLPNFTIPPKVTVIEGSLFRNCINLLSIDIHNDVTQINFQAFGSCTSLPRIRIPPKVKSIERHTFEFCYNLSSIAICGNLTSIGYAAFAYCSSLTFFFYNGITIPSYNSNDRPYLFLCSPIDMVYVASKYQSDNS